jgi:hypothetical protein
MCIHCQTIHTSIVYVIYSLMIRRHVITCLERYRSTYDVLIALFQQ